MQGHPLKSDNRRFSNTNESVFPVVDVNKTPCNITPPWISEN